MTRRLLALLLVIAAAACLAGCSKDWCVSKYGLVEPSASPTPGPIIIVHKDASTGALQWYVDSGTGSTLQSGVGSAFDSGYIRNDFMGTKILDFTVKKSTTSYSPANYVVFQTQVGSDTYLIEIVRTAGDKVRWYMTKNGSVRKLLASGSVTAGQVPVELTGTLVELPTYSFREQVEDVDIDSIDFLRVAL